MQNEETMNDNQTSAAGSPSAFCILHSAFFSTPERIAQLQAVAARWLGTPFMANVAVRGTGVSCQKLVCRLYVETGVWPPDFDVPEGPMDWSHARTRSLIAQFMDSRPEFLQIDNPQSAIGNPGDMLGFKIGGCVHHCGIVLDAASGRFIHCLRHHGVLISTLKDASYLSRIGNIWRPMQRQNEEVRMQNEETR